jgi:hypothetical protein
MTLFLVMHIVQYLKKRFILGRRNKLHSHVPVLVGTSLVMMYYLYLNLTRSVLDMFNCQPTTPPDGHTYLRTYGCAVRGVTCARIARLGVTLRSCRDTEVVFEPCNRPGGVRMTLLPYAIIALCVYTVGYPVLVFLILNKYHDRIMEDQLLRAEDRGADRLENPNCYDIRKMYHKYVDACSLYSALVSATDADVPV